MSFFQLFNCLAIKFNQLPPKVLFHFDFVKPPAGTRRTWWTWNLDLERMPPDIQTFSYKVNCARDLKGQDNGCRKKWMYFPNNATQNYPFSRFKLVVLTFKPTNQNSLNSSKLLSQRMRKLWGPV